MSTDDLAKQLHDKATRGIVLSAAEQAQLDIWYAEQDQAEGAILALTTPPDTLATLHTQVDTAVSQLLTVTQRIQELAAQNDVLRHDIAALQRQLAQTPAVPPA
jgi:phosphoglycerate-specific signal transduction histidine kinase